jgi:hypothetical protein
VVLLSVGGGVAPARAQRLPQTEHAEPAPVFTGDTIPDPPQQRQPWLPRKTSLPDTFVSATAKLYDQGLADPRGCEYREIVIGLGSLWVSGDDTLKTHGWVLPGKKGDKQRFAVCWTGLVTPCIEVGAPADLKEDVRKGAAAEEAIDFVIAGRKEQLEGTGGATLRRLSGSQPLILSLLLRLGEGRLAEEFWNSHPELRDLAASRSKAYSAIGSAWASHTFERALWARLRGDDKIALHDFQLLAAAAKPVNIDARQRGSNLQIAADQLTGFIKPGLSRWLEDQKRRLRSPHPPVPCIGPGREPNQSRRIAALIDRLDEVAVREIDTPGSFGERLQDDPVVQALIAEGAAAVEPLIKCIEKDDRLTRSIVYPFRDYSFTPIGVCEPAHHALRRILDHESFDEDGHWDDLRENWSSRRKSVAAALRQRWQEIAKMPFAERCYGVLADDKSPPEQWLKACDALAQWGGWDGWHGVPLSAFSFDPQLMARRNGRLRLVADSLPPAKKANLKELIIKRIGQMDSGAAASMGERLVVWDRAAALPILAELTTRCAQDDSLALNFERLIMLRESAGDKQVLQEYMAWLRRVKPEVVGEHFDVLLQHLAGDPDYPGMRATAEALFGDQKSPWLHWLYQPGSDGVPEANLCRNAASALLRFDAFRKIVLKELTNEATIGSVELSKDGKLRVNGPEGSSYEPDFADATAEPDDKGGDFRACDYCAWQISENIDGAPRSELYWSLQRRDNAVAACEAFLGRFGPRVGWSTAFPRFKRPATLAQYKKGDAIFSLDGEGAARLVNLAELPLDAKWTALRECHGRFPCNRYDVGHGFFQCGRVWQAEELFRNGRWQRYYGFIGAHHVSRVRAEEIEFLPPELDPLEPQRWVRLPGGLDARLDLRGLVPEPKECCAQLTRYAPARLPFEAPLPVGLRVHCRAGLDRSVPCLGGGLRLDLRYSAESLSRQGMLAPAVARESEWVKIPSKFGAVLPSSPKQTLTPAEEVATSFIDLRELFEIERPGWYQLRLSATPADAAEAPERVEVKFVLIPAEGAR